MILLMTTPETLAKEIAQKVAASLEAALTPVLTAALADARKEWGAEAEKELQKMRDWVRAAPIAVAAPFALTADESRPEPETDSRGYAARGATPKAVTDVLKAHPGLKTREIMRRVIAANPTISKKSIANELSRGKAKNRYRRENPGSWFNM